LNGQFQAIDHSTQFAQDPSGRFMLDALILAAGQGSRLDVGVPKCLVEIGGRSLLDHQLDAIERVGADRVTLVVGYEHEQIEDAAKGRTQVVLNERYAETNSLYSFWLARNAVEGDLLVLNSDVLFAPEMLCDLAAVTGSTIAFDSSSGDEDEHMKVHIQRGRLMRLSKDLPPMDSHGESLGVVLLRRPAARAAFSAAGSYIGRGRDDHWVTTAFNEVARGHWVSCVDVAAQPWVEIDFPEDLDRARNHTWPAIAALGREHGSPDDRWSPWMEPDEMEEVGT
jgi:choline kinase